MKDRVSRRSVLAGTAAIAGGSAFVLTSGSETAQASVAVDELGINDQTHISDGTESTVDLEVDINYNWSGQVTPDRWELTLLAGATKGRYPIESMESTEPLENSGSGSETLTGSLVSTPAFDLSQFQRDSGSSSHNVEARIRFELFHSGSSIGISEATESFTIEVIGGELAIDMSVSGTGEVNIG